MESRPLKTHQSGMCDQPAECPRVASPFYATRGRFISRGVIASVVTMIILLIILVAVLGALLGKAGPRGTMSLEGQENKDNQDPTPFDGQTTPGTDAWWNVRLPHFISPKHYDVTVRVDLKKFKFNGHVIILINVTNPTKYVLLHANELRVTLVSAQTIKGNKLSIKKHFWFERNQLHVIHFDCWLAAGEYVINMSFESVLTSDLSGFYRMQYKRSDGIVSHMAATQFSPADARKAFPCFDEPAMKATFNVTLIHDSNLIALSNMPIYQSRQEKDGWTYDKFQKSAVMSTYLVAFAICDFKYVEVAHNNSFKISAFVDISQASFSVRIYTPQEQIDQVEYVSKITDSLLTFFEEYFDIKYALPKVDMIAIPNFLHGAMENWGLITYRDLNLLYKANISSSFHKQRVAEVVSHELAHQWFGNLVTMEWWDDFWLNEGFASFMEFRSMDFIHPDWKMDDQVVVADMFAAFAEDSMESSHPIRISIKRPNDISQIFDSITYDKGACILRMLESYLGKDVFRRGLSRYLKKFEYANAKTQNLWQVLEEESCMQGRCVNVNYMMDTWTLQMGYPVIDIRHLTGNQYLVSQQRFLNHKDVNATPKFSSPFNYKWFVPFTYISSSGSQTVITKEINMTSEKILCNGSGWIKGNAGQKGFYRVNYDDQNWDALANAFKNDHKVMNVSDRAGVIGDAFALARSGKINYTKALELTSYLPAEMEYVPWVAAVKSFNLIKKLLTPTRPAYKLLQRYVLRQAKPIYERLEFTDRGSHLESLLQPIILDTVCAAGEKLCLLNASNYFHEWMKDPRRKQVPANFRSLVYYYGIANGGREEWEFSFNQFLSTSVASEKNTLMRGLAASSEPWILSRYLQLSLDTDVIKSSDTPMVISRVAEASHIGRQLAWDFILRHWKTLKTRYSEGLNVLKRLLEDVTAGFTNEFQLQQVYMSIGHSVYVLVLRNSNFRRSKKSSPFP